MEKIIAEGAKIKSQQYEYYTLFQKVFTELSQLESSLTKQEMDCYMNKNELCLTHYDNFLLASLDLDRKNDKLEKEKEKSCWSVIPFSLKPKSEFDWNVKTVEVLDQYKKYLQCATPFYDKSLHLLQEKADLKKSLLKKVSRV
jgi:CMP-N-acetylneuraminic acid synthetase